MTITVDQMVQREINCCLSGLVSTLASACYVHSARAQLASSLGSARELGILTKQAYGLASPIPDYEEAAIEAGWYRDVDGDWMAHDQSEETGYLNEAYESAQSLCEAHGIEPFESDVYEHWSVSQWLADRLIAHGEKVDDDFAGMSVWARTCTGQSISCDSVIQRIHAALIGEDV